MKPVIGLSTTYTHNDSLGSLLHMGVPGQSYHVCTDDFVQDLLAADAVPVLLPTVRTEVEREEQLAMLDGIIFCGGADIYTPLYRETTRKECGPVVPEQDNHEVALAKLAIKHDLPILGVCRGMQLLNVALGGTLYQDLPSQKPESLYHSNETVPRFYGVHSLEIAPHSLLSRLFPQAPYVNSFHHQAVKDVAPSLCVTARAADGVIEALERPGKSDFLAVQWHPEMMAPADEKQQALFAWLVRCAQEKKNR